MGRTRVAAKLLPTGSSQLILTSRPLGSRKRPVRTRAQAGFLRGVIVSKFFPQS